jgi:endonuclease YncB( thermonuclease family)
MPAPPLGWTTDAKVVSIHDGDTLTVEVTRQFKIRLLDCYAPEVVGTEKPDGVVSRDHLRGMALGHDVTLHIPGGFDFAHVTSLSRVLGQLWLPGDEKSLAEHQVEAGMATKQKQ